MLLPKFSRSDTLCSLQTREGEAGTGITPPPSAPKHFIQIKEISVIPRGPGLGKAKGKDPI